jgi:hypothetical protein
MADDDGLPIELADLVCMVCNHIGNAVTRDPLGVGTGLGDRGGVTRPADRARGITGLAERVDPRAPGVCVEPEPVNEDDWGTASLYWPIVSRRRGEDKKRSRCPA